MSKERPILFSAPMVRAILDGSKSQTRRICKPAQKSFLTYVVDCLKGLWGDEGGDVQFKCPYGQPGDRLWVRETLACTYAHGVWYAADEGEFFKCIEDERAAELAERYGHPYFATEQRKIPSIHMPRWASRILLEIVNVRVERLQDISEADAKAEGIKSRAVRTGVTPAPVTVYGLGTDNDWCSSAAHAFQDLWEQINGAESWAANPWVWVVEFKRVTA
jgi:hypothetical protein